MAQLVKCLLDRHKDMHSDFQHSHEKPGWAAGSFSAVEVETWDPWSLLAGVAIGELWVQ